MSLKANWRRKTVAVVAYVSLSLGMMFLVVGVVFAYPPRSPFFVFSGPAGPAVALCPTPLSGIVSYWPGEGNAFDAVDGNDGTIGVGVSYANGYVDQAISFSGSGGVSIADSASLDVQDAFTLVAWVNSSSLVAGADIVKRTGGAFGEGYMILTDSTSGSNYRCQIDCGDNCDANLISTTPVSVGTFQHVACTFDGSTMKLYVNGSPEGSTAAAKSPNIDGMAIGGGNFEGLIDGAGVYNRALSDAEVSGLYNSGVTCACSDGVRNGDETDIDCGGGACSACNIGQQCSIDSDCSTNSCVGGLCAGACIPTPGEEVVEMSCTDFVDNDCDTLTDASDSDCSVPAAGNISPEQSSPVATLTITDPIAFGEVVVGSSAQLGSPTSYKFLAEAFDEDSGTVLVNLTVGDLASVGAGAGTALICNDGQLNGGETDVDCGGSVCSGCADGKVCSINQDCSSNNCIGGFCQSSVVCTQGDVNNNALVNCVDLELMQLVVAGTEDGDSFACSDQNNDGFYTSADTQLVQEAIDNKGLICVTCGDGIQNQDETDVDCGGSACGGCADGKVCSVDGDCQSGSCSGGVCVATANCSDGIQNQDETGVDCGGSCPTCPPGFIPPFPFLP